MPNHVKNIIRFSENASQDKIDELFQTVVGVDKHDEPIFDFNALIPMPESLNIEAGSVTQQAIKLYRAMQLSQKCMDETAAEKATRVYKIAELFQKRIDKEGNKIYILGQTSCRDIRKIPELLQRYIDNDGKEIYALGKKACKNIEQYGYADWYDWRIANWGTKWNSYDVTINKDEREVAFHTAWSFPGPIAAALTERFPDVDFIWDYADEDAGYGTGEFMYEGGEISYIELDGGSDEAYQMYISCWDDHDLYKDEDGRWKRRMLEDEWN